MTLSWLDLILLNLFSIERKWKQELRTLITARIAAFSSFLYLARKCYKAAIYSVSTILISFRWLAYVFYFALTLGPVSLPPDVIHLRHASSEGGEWLLPGEEEQRAMGKPQQQRRLPKIGVISLPFPSHLLFLHLHWPCRVTLLPAQCNRLDKEYKHLKLVPQVF